MHEGTNRQGKTQRDEADLLVSSMRLALRAVLPTFQFAPGELVHGKSARRVPDRDCPA
ncbi:hypothetical protein [Methylocaldum sp. RMAD-M]|jgi:hypothetical protein|uniref:hypothetical protein n=1 Tax=unclassified Methylocaldum TaxID=2622260 RepID=UPI00143D7500|nr:hypothetical protein [Methylocaldum sp. RMAD-M]MBP1152353.1 hypothetical protein [Methylocaldum sp. RMAD-M]MDV3241835.1 hypothetical protein [Methylocaldum sp.]